MNVVIFANGTPPDKEEPLQRIDRAELLIAADGGATLCKDYGVMADVLVGDLDSISPELLEEYRRQHKEIQHHPRRKNATDLELCMDLALKRGATRLDIIGSLGGRWDMSFGNVLLAASPRYRSMQIYLFEKDCKMMILNPPGPYRIAGRKGMTVSFLPLSPTAEGVFLTDVEYPLENHRIPFGSSLGLSNVFTKNEMSVQLTSGVLLAVIDKKS